MKTQIEEISHWIEQFSLSQVPEQSLEMTKLQVLDCVASIIAGYRSEPGKKIYQALKKYSHTENSGSHIVLPTGEKWFIENSVYLHAALINALELDNFSYMGHLSESAFPVALAVSEKTGATETQFLESFICSQEISGRLGAYMAMGKLQGHMRSFIHRICAAVATVKLYNCSADVIAQAMAISLSSPEMPLFPSSFSPDTKVNCVSSATVEGMRSAFLAMEGFAAASDIIEHPAGFVKEFSHFSHVPVFWKTLGKTWVMDSISFKYYSSCGYAQGPINAVLEATKAQPVETENIQSIHLYSPILTVVMEEFSKPHRGAGLTPVNINFSTKRSVSAALLYGGPDGGFFADGNDRRYHDQIQQLSEKIFIHHDWNYTIKMIQGIDACLENAGYPGVFDIGTSDHTLKHLQKVYKNRTIFSNNEFWSILNLPRKDLFYLLKRVLKSALGRKGFTELKAFEKDLSKLQFAIGSKAIIFTKTGEKLSGECSIPKGFAGDPNQRERVLEKFDRECIPVFGNSITQNLKNQILNNGYPILK